MTKGSGSNGVDTVYQVGTAGQLPTPATAASTTITPLPGFPTSGTATHPFGLWFGNATTLFVADEGDGQAVGTPGKDTSNAGLDEYTLSGGTSACSASPLAGGADNPGARHTRRSNPRLTKRCEPLPPARRS